MADDDVEAQMAESGCSPAAIRAVETLRSLVGCRVRRNEENWEWGDQDGGEGRLGTVVDVRLDGWAGVKWDIGHYDGYRIGAEGKWDLTVVEGGTNEDAERARQSLLNSNGEAVVNPAETKQPTIHADPLQRNPDLGPTVAEILAEPFEAVWGRFPVLRELATPEGGTMMEADWEEAPFGLRDTLRQMRDRGAFRPGQEPGDARPPGVDARSRKIVRAKKRDGAGGSGSFEGFLPGAQSRTEPAGNADQQGQDSNAAPKRHPLGWKTTGTTVTLQREAGGDSSKPHPLGWNLSANAPAPGSEGGAPVPAEDGPPAKVHPLWGTARPQVSSGGGGDGGSISYRCVPAPDGTELGAAAAASATLRELRAHCDSIDNSDAYAVALKTLLIYAQNTQRGEEKFRRVSTTNTAFAQRIGAHPPAMELMRMLGFEEQEGGIALVLPPGKNVDAGVIAAVSSAQRTA